MQFVQTQKSMFTDVVLINTNIHIDRCCAPRSCLGNCVRGLELGFCQGVDAYCSGCCLGLARRCLENCTAAEPQEVRRCRPPRNCSLPNTDNRRLCCSNLGSTTPAHKPGLVPRAGPRRKSLAQLSGVILSAVRQAMSWRNCLGNTFFFTRYGGCKR